MRYESHGGRQKPRTWQDVKYEAIACIVIIAFIAITWQVVKRLIHREPYRMILECVDGRTVVQFARDDQNLVSPTFDVNLPCDQSQEVILRSSRMSIPGCVIEFCDTTILPGRFTIRIGDVTYDVMESGIDVDGKTFAWKDRGTGEIH